MSIYKMLVTIFNSYLLSDVKLTEPDSLKNAKQEKFLSVLR